MATNIIGGLAGLATVFAQNFWQFSLARFFAGFAFDNCFIIMYILGMTSILRTRYIDNERSGYALPSVSIYLGFDSVLMREIF